MRDAVVVGAVRTPLGRRRGGLAEVHPADLSATLLQGLAERDKLDPAMVDDVIWGCVGQVGEQTGDIGRTALLSAGWPEAIPGVTVDRACGSSQQQAVSFAAAGIIAGLHDIAIAGGAESMSRVPMGTAFTIALDPKTAASTGASPGSLAISPPSPQSPRSTAPPSAEGPRAFMEKREPAWTAS